MDYAEWLCATNYDEYEPDYLVVLVWNCILLLREDNEGMDSEE
jgi:hypothetical protein